MTGRPAAVTQLAHVLGRVGIDVDAVELAEILWVATRHVVESSRPPPTEEQATSPDLTVQESLELPAEELPPPGDPNPVEPRDVAPVSPNLALPNEVERLAYPVPSAVNKGVGFQLADPVVLPDRLRLAQALRPFKRRHPASRSREFDVDATVEVYGQTGLLVPLQKAALERWFDVTLVVDASPTMDMWKQTTTELTRLLAGHGAFRKVQRLHLIEDDGTHALCTDSRRRVRLRPTSSTGGRHVIMVVSDCVGGIWYRDDLWQSVRDWAKHSPVVFVQTLPARLWEYSALGPTDASMGGGFRPGQPNNRLRTVLPWWAVDEFDDVVAMPVVGLTEPDFARWARMVMGGADVQVPGVLVPAFAPEPSPQSAATPEARVAAFKATVSVEAYQLAVCMSAIPVQLPVARIVQHVVVGSRDLVHLAEIFVGGVIRRDTPVSANVPPDEVVYDFLPGVREVLQRSLTGSRTLEIFRALARHLKQTAGVGTSYAALLAGVSGDAALAPEFQAFADIGRPLVERFGLAVSSGREPSRTSNDVSAVRAPHRRPPRSPADRMKILQPMMFVGLGGTGCKVGAELEKRLRQELCGPDGTGLLAEMYDPNFLPYQLPSCLQFVYADLSLSELERVRREVVPGREHEQAAQKTMHQITDLVPAYLGNSADVAQSLRINTDEDLIQWLPPKEGDPRVGPLVRGAGQLPAVGRSVLFETIRRNPDTALLGIKRALSDINESGGDLYVVSGKRTQRVDTVVVFVVFSVTGGTGGGIFYDYLHLIGEMMRRAGKVAEIYPLVLMPSAFDDVQGGGRPAELNAGSALIDLFHLVDDQNAQGSPDELDDRGRHSGISVRYPQLYQVQLPPNTVQTAFLFGRPVGGMRRDDLTRSMASLMTSLIGEGLPGQDDEQAWGWSAQSFADGFINSTVDRRSATRTGVGRRGVMTSAVAGLITPLSELTEVLSSRLLADAVNTLAEPDAAETNKQYIRQVIAASGLEPLLEARPVRIPSIGDPIGYGPVLAALNKRADAMKAALESPGRLVTTLALNFDPSAGAAVSLRSVDLFRLHRIVFGHREFADPVDRGGFGDLLEGWLLPPAPPPGITADAPPSPASLQRKFLRQIRITDEAAQEVIRRQDAWYAWQTRRLWNASWNDSQRLWSRPWRAFREELSAVQDAFVTHARNAPTQFDLRSRDLYKTRVGVTYLLPTQEGGLEGLYRTMLARMKQDPALDLGPDAHAGQVLNRLIGHEDWGDAFMSGRSDPKFAVVHILERTREKVSEFLRSDDHGHSALVPRMEDLLADAAQRLGDRVTEADPLNFRHKLAELVPDGFSPDGHGPLKAMITYPAATRNAAVEEFLRREISLPGDMAGQPDFRAVQTDSLSVGLTRSSMGIIDVPEARRVVKLWAEAHNDPQPSDMLAWRRRLPHDSDYMVMSVHDRQMVLHRLLCAAWNGRVSVTGNLSSPRSISIELMHDSGVSMRLDPVSIGELSSWGGVVLAYERWVLADDSQGKGDLLAEIMSGVPAGATTLSPAPPAPEFDKILELADQELTKISEAEHEWPAGAARRLAVFREFWCQLLPEALSLRFGEFGVSLSELHRRVKGQDR